MRVVIFMLATGCNVLGNNYNVVVSPYFSKDNQATATLAAQNWQDILGGELHVTSVTVGQCAHIEREICIVPSTEAWNAAHGAGDEYEFGFTLRLGIQDRANIYIPMDVDQYLSSDLMEEIFAHEIGHAMGLKHTQEGTLMYWTSDVQSTLPTCDDVAQWLTIRHYPSVKTINCPDGGSFTFYH